MMPATILVIDDDDLIQFTVREILEDEGYTVETATDGLDALAKLDGFFPALILLDITMPRMDGYEFAERLQQLGLHARIPVIVLTADGRAQQKAARVGAAGYLHKPFSIPALLEAAAKLL